MANLNARLLRDGPEEKIVETVKRFIKLWGEPVAWPSCSPIYRPTHLRATFTPQWQQPVPAAASRLERTWMKLGYRTRAGVASGIHRHHVRRRLTGR